ANYEAMLRLNPDLVMVTYSQTEVAEFFSRRPDVEVLVTEPTETLAEIDRALLKVAAAIGRTQQAQDLIAARPKPSNKERPEARPKVLWVVGYGPGLSQLYAVGHGNYLTELIEAAGGENVVPPDAGLYPMLNKEMIV